MTGPAATAGPRSRGRRDRRAVALALAALLAATGGTGAQAAEGLDSLVPLIEVYAASRTDTPGFDVAGIRCAGLWIAQREWARRHPGTGGPSRAQLGDVEENLTASEIHRRNAGLDVVEAQDSVRADVLRVIALYTERFEARSAAGSHPWRGDGLIRGDTAYCDILGARR